SGPWRTMTPSARGRLLMRLAYLITANSDRVAALETRKNGKLISEMTRKFATLLNGTDISAALADKIAYTRREPVGVVAAIVPGILHFSCWPGSSRLCSSTPLATHRPRLPPSPSRSRRPDFLRESQTHRY